jgi:hypothetical protein
MFQMCFVLQEHIKNEKLTTVTEAMTTTSVPEMNSTDTV